MLFRKIKNKKNYLYLNVQIATLTIRFTRGAHVSCGLKRRWSYWALLLGAGDQRVYFHLRKFYLYMFPCTHLRYPPRVDSVINSCGPRRRPTSSSNHMITVCLLECREQRGSLWCVGFDFLCFPYRCRKVNALTSYLPIDQSNCF